jgi:hypothetical protein
MRILLSLSMPGLYPVTFLKVETEVIFREIDTRVERCICMKELLPVPAQAVRRQEEGGVASAGPQRRPPHRLRGRTPARRPGGGGSSRRTAAGRRRRLRLQQIRAGRAVLRRGPVAVTRVSERRL